MIVLLVVVDDASLHLAIYRRCNNVTNTSNEKRARKLSNRRMNQLSNDK